MTNQISKIPKDWKMTTLGKVARVLSGSTPSTKEDTYWDGNIPWITPKDLSGYSSVYIQRGERNITDEGLKNSSAQILTKNTILFSSRAPIGYVVIAKNDVTTNQGFKNIICDEKESHFKYFYYWLKKNTGYIEGLSSGSTFSEASATVMKSLLVELPPLPEQRAIAAVLSSFDNKIELLREQNKTLEAIAQTIFKEWFVNFNFPDKNGKPYKDSGGKMVNSESGEIPEGWRVDGIKKLFDFAKGIEPGSNNYFAKKISEDYLPFYRVQDTSGYDKIPSIFVNIKTLKEKIFKNDDILISLDGTVGRIFVGGAGGYSSGIRKIIGKKSFISKFFIYCFLKSNKFQNELNSFSGAETTIKHAGGAIEHIKFNFEKNICEKFEKLSDPLFQKLISNISQIQTLSKTRDTLLPKLMKGEIRVREFQD